MTENQKYIRVYDNTALYCREEVKDVQTLQLYNYECTNLSPSEVFNLIAENEALKARIAKAVELPCIRTKTTLGYDVFQVIYEASGVVMTEQYGNIDFAEKRLKELEDGRC